MTWPQWWFTSAKNEKKQSGPYGEDIKSTVQDLVQSVEQKVDDVVTDPAPTVSRVTHAFLEPQNLVATAVLTTVLIGCLKVYKTYLRRIPEATNIHQSYFRKRSILGKVTSVGDGDNFRIFHTPGGWLAGWGWLPWRRVPVNRKLLKNKTIHIRLAGIDAPELAHFGRPSQPYSKEALEWLTSYVLGRRVRAYVYKSDQYSRVVATAYVWKGLVRRDIGLQMLRAGFATVYEAKTGAEFGEGLEPKYRRAEQWAKLKRKGMWSGDMKNYESPREYKNRYMTKEDASEK